MAQNYQSRFLETIGIEIESEIIDRQSITNATVLRFGKGETKLPFQISRDASTESVLDYITFTNNQKKYLQINTHNSLYKKYMRPSNTSTGGYELILNPMTLQQLQPVLYKMENALQDVGDSVTDRSAIHFHIGFAHNLRYMKKLLAVCLKLDPLFYRLGGFGRTFRGYSNLAAYARPLLNSAAVPLTGPVRETGGFAPPRVAEWDDDEEHHDEFEEEEEREMARRNTGYVQAINPLGALTAKTTDGFWSNFSVHPSITGMPKYHPSRYVGCNFYAILAHGTMEFRHFNQVIDAELIFTTAKFLRAVVDMSVELKKPELVWFNPMPPEKEIGMDDVAEIMWNLRRLFAEHDIVDSPTEGEIDYLTNVIESSHFVEIPQIPVLTHNREFYLPENLAIGLKKVANPLKPSHVDIHTIGFSSILPGDF